MCSPLVTGEKFLPLSRHKIVATARDDEAADAISRSLIPIKITKLADRNYFRFDMNACRLAKLLIGFNQFNVNTELEGSALEDTVIIAFGREQGRPSCAEFDSEPVEVSEKSAAVYSTNRRVRNIRPSGAGSYVVRMSSAVLKARCEEITEQNLTGPLKFAPAVDLTKGQGLLLREIFYLLLSELERSGPDMENTLRSSILERVWFNKIQDSHSALFVIPSA
jgi:hypothetical protein